MTVVYDAGLLIAADRGDREVLVRHYAHLDEDILPVTTAPVVAQVSRSPRQVLLRRLLETCEIVDFSHSDAHAVGALLARSGTSDVVDAHLVLTASRRDWPLLTGDEDDLNRLSECLAQPVDVRGIPGRS